jgi:hypothetical protein
VTFTLASAPENVIGGSVTVGVTGLPAGRSGMGESGATVAVRLVGFVSSLDASAAVASPERTASAGSGRRMAGSTDNCGAFCRLSAPSPAADRERAVGPAMITSAAHIGALVSVSGFKRPHAIRNPGSSLGKGSSGTYTGGVTERSCSSRA